MRLKKEDILKRRISCSENAYLPISQISSIENALNQIKNGDYNKQIKRVRESPSSEEQKQRKKELPLYIFAGVFSDRNDSSIQQYSQICVLDFDHVGDVKAAKEEIFYNDYVFSVWTSPSGDGVKALIAFDFSSFEIEKEIEYVNLHKEAFKQFNAKNVFSNELDKSGCNIGRSCFTSSDSELMIKDEVVAFHVEKGEKKNNKRNNKRTLTENKSPKISKENLNTSLNDLKKIQPRRNDKNRREMNSLCKFLCKRKLSITSTYGEWFNIAQAIANIFPYSIGKKYFIRLCELDEERHDEDASIKKLKECYLQRREDNEPKFGLKSIKEAAKAKGWKLGEES